MIKITPTEAFWDAMLLAAMGSGYQRYQRPGAIVEALSPEKREALQNLRSEQLQDRPDEVAKYVFLQGNGHELR
jgi:hypothetical protein